MNQTSQRTADVDHGPDYGSAGAPIYPLQSFLEIQRLMTKLHLTPADCLQLLAEVLGDLDRQIEEHEAEGDGLPFPPM